MYMAIHNSSAVDIFVSSIDVTALRPSMTAIKILAEDGLKWDSLTEHLTEEVHGLKAGFSSKVILTVVLKNACQICGKENHSTS